VSISSSSLIGQPPAYEGLLDNIKNANTIYEGQRQRILFLESAYIASQNQALQLEYAYLSCKSEVEEAEIIIDIMYRREDEYIGIIKQHKTKEIIYQTALGATLSYIIYNLIFK
jgi:hypothetical protein